jgi:holo-[acyl-carrier protein] synthase
LIYGVGVDIVDTARIEAALERFGERFAARILTTDELQDFAIAPRPGAFLAKRFAAKEAFGKALGTGIRAPAHLHAIRVVRDALGRPSLRFGHALDAWLRARGIARHHLSLSDERTAAVAVVVLETADVPA